MRSEKSSSAICGKTEIGTQQAYIVFYTKNGKMRECIFDTEQDANEFSITVNGSVAPIMI